ncbi:MAG: discoidin domain-containing protein [Sedimentisphaerales bacterium]|nr:discoidin domain-containing protein [Sedimentisphaerales bacterium]
MSKKQIFLLLLCMVLSITPSLSAESFNATPVLEIYVGNDSWLGPGTQNPAAQTMHIFNTDSAAYPYLAGAPGRQVAYSVYDLAELKAEFGTHFSDVSLSIAGNYETYNDNFNIYGVLEAYEDQVKETMTWNTAPGLKPGALGAPIELEATEITDVLLTVSDLTRDATIYLQNSEALAQFLNSDTNGKVVLMFSAPRGNETIIYSLPIQWDAGVQIYGDIGHEPVKASNPKPGDKLDDVYSATDLRWTPGIYAATHNVYLSTIFDDVNDGVALVGPGLVTNIYNPGKLEFGKTYYWRVDEVNAPPDSTVFEGDIWSFTVEPLARSISADNITATASSQAEDQGPENTINESGLVDDLHSTNTADMWSTADGEPLPAWIQYEFDKPYQLHEMLVWNYNGVSFLASLGLKDVTVEYSTDGVNWTLNDSVSVFNKSTGTDDYSANTMVPFGDVTAKYVKITVNSNWGGEFFTMYGLSEVRFLYIPVSARLPNPDDGTNGVDTDVTLSWRAGREAAEHKVYISTDEEVVIGGTVAAETVSEASYGPLSLDLGSTYYWRVDEVNNTNSTQTWEGSVWSFTTDEYRVVDDFESYNDIPQGEEGSNLVYLTWIDGYDNPSTNGSTMGYVSGSSLEIATVRSGRSAPLMYNNTTAGISKVTANTNNLQSGSDWTIGSPEQLVLWIYGSADNPSTDRMYIEVDGVKKIFSGDIAAEQWQDFPIDLASLGINLSNVGTVTIGLEKIGATGGSGTVFIDDIWLYSPAAAQ